jgi:F0F1-type ATP synthase assembly protein I
MSASEPPREPRGTPSGEPGDLARLGERIDRLRGDKPGEPDRSAAAQGKALSAGWRISIELVVAVVFCGLVGWLIDVWLGSRPWAMIVGVVLGFVVGVRAAMKTANQMEADYLRQEAEKRGGTQDGKR